MRLVASLLFVMLCLPGCLTSDRADPDTGPPPPPKFDTSIPVVDAAPVETDKLRLITYNVKNLFDLIDDPSKFDDVVTQQALDAQLGLLANAIRQINPDIIGFQEVENEWVLNQLVGGPLGDLGYDHVVLIEGNDPRGIDVALVSKFPISNVKSHKNEVFPGVTAQDMNVNYKFSRDCLEAVVTVAPNVDIYLLVNHLKASSSSNPTESDLRRAAQAARVREIADDLISQHGDPYLAVIGDLNDEPGSLSTNQLTDPQPLLFDVLTLVPSSERRTVRWQSGKQLDYLLLSSALRGVLVDSSVHVENGDLYADASDHFPVVAEFDFGFDLDRD